MSTTTSAATPSLKLVSLEQIHIPEGGNPRKRFDERALQELADPIGKPGVLQPLVARPPQGGDNPIAVNASNRSSQPPRPTRPRNSTSRDFPRPGRKRSRWRM